MPDVKVYIRQDNVAKWNAIPNKSQWINTLLANSDNTSEYGAVKNTPAERMVPVLSEELPPEESPEFKQFLKDYSQPGTRRPHPEFGYPCCWNKSKKCKHWIWSGEDSAYVNELTNEVIEVI